MAEPRVSDESVAAWCASGEGKSATIHVRFPEDMEALALDLRDSRAEVARLREALKGATHFDASADELERLRETVNEEVAQFNAGVERAEKHTGPWPLSAREYEPTTTDRILADLGERDHDSFGSGFAWGAYERMARTLAAVEPVVRAAVAYWAAINEPGFQIVSAPLDAAVDALRPETRAEYTGEVYLHAASTAGKTFRDDGATTPEGCEAQDEGFA